MANVPIIMENHSSYFNPFSANVPIVEKPGSWFLLAEFSLYEK